MIVRYTDREAGLRSPGAASKLEFCRFHAAARVFCDLAGFAARAGAWRKGSGEAALNPRCRPATARASAPRKNRIRHGRAARHTMRPSIVLGGRCRQQRRLRFAVQPDAQKGQMSSARAVASPVSLGACYIQLHAGYTGQACFRSLSFRELDRGRQGRRRNASCSHGRHALDAVYSRSRTPGSRRARAAASDSAAAG